MTEILTALAIAAGLLSPVVIIVILASIVAVNRGEGAAHHGHHEAASDASASEPVAEPAGDGGNLLSRLLPQRDPSVLEILILGTVIFTVTMGLFFAYSVISRLG